MKTLIACLFLQITSIPFGIAQNQFYDFNIFAGLSPQQTPVQAGLIVNRENPENEFVFNLESVEKQFTVGFTKNFRFNGSFFGTLGLQYSREQKNYAMSFTHPELSGKNDFALKTSRHMITLPAGIGVKLNKLEVISGLQVQYGIKSEMKEDIPMGFDMDKSRMEMGWYTGIGFSYDRTRIGIQYHSTLHRDGYNLMYHQKPMELMNVPGNFNFTIGYSF